jgi:hypothetical protein
MSGEWHPVLDLWCLLVTEMKSVRM